MKRPQPIEPTGWSEAIYPVVVLSLGILISTVIYRQVAELVREPEPSPEEWGKTAVSGSIDRAACDNGWVIYWDALDNAWSCHLDKEECSAECEEAK
jgi:hypothetical protein